MALFKYNNICKKLGSKCVNIEQVRKIFNSLKCSNYGQNIRQPHKCQYKENIHVYTRLSQHKCVQYGHGSRSMASFWRRDKKTSEEDEKALELVTKRKQTETDHNMTHSLKLLAAKSRLDNKRAYTPPDDLEQRVQNIVNAECGSDKEKDWRDIPLTDRRRKFQVLSRLVTEFDHDIPASTLSQIHTVQQAVDHFSIPVKCTHALEDISRQSDLPENLHIQLDYKRFDPEKDPLFGGKTAYPGRDTVVTSIKYKRVYKDIKTKTVKPGYYNHYENY